MYCAGVMMCCDGKTGVQKVIQCLSLFTYLEQLQRSGCHYARHLTREAPQAGRVLGRPEAQAMGTTIQVPQQLSGRGRMGAWCC